MANSSIVGVIGLVRQGTETGIVAVPACHGRMERVEKAAAASQPWSPRF